ncbi:MAG: hypothetical protein ACRYGP_16600 [Janthinobacterium lividum]
MSALVIPFTRDLPDPRVEISSPGVNIDGARIFYVDIIEADARAIMWSGIDIDEAYQAAAECAEGEGSDLPILDLLNTTGVTH